MPRNSKKAPNIPQFANEAAEADWYASAEGQRAAERALRKGIRNGTVQVNPNGLDVQRTDPAKLQELVDRVQASMTRAVSLRIENSDLEEAKRIAEKKGIGYQTVLKEAIREGLAKARL